MRKIRGLRWWIVVLVFLAAVLNYVDRQTLSALAPTVQADLGLDERDYANVLNLFLLAYTIAYLISGKLVDRLGTRAGTTAFVIWWSLANMATAWAQGLRSLGACRFLLGLGEAGVWPAASKAVSEWFPSRERALAIGLYTMGAMVGAMLAPQIAISLAKADYAASFPAALDWFPSGTGWRIAFLVTGLAGFVWLVPWLLFYRKPRESGWVTAHELSHIEDGGSPDREVEKPWSWGRVLCYPPVWLLLLGRLLTDPVWYFYQFWFAKYLSSERGLQQAELTVTWQVYAAAGLGSLAGGWLSGWLVKRGVAPVRARLCVMLACAAIMPLSPLIAYAGGLPLALTLTGFAVFAALAWLINISALVVDLVPQHSLGTAFGIVAAGSTLGGIAMNLLVATMVAGPSAKAPGFLDQAVQTVCGPLLDAVGGRGYGPWFVAMAFLHPLALLLLWAGGIQRRNPALQSP